LNLKLTLEYDGTGFHGWARQPGLRTVEGVVHEGLDAVFPRWDGLAVAGRTDTGVHATGQVASVAVEGGPPTSRAAEALTAALPDDVAVIRAEEVPEGFNARFSARSRSYRYRVLVGATRSPLEAHRALWWPRPVDVVALQAAAGLLVGRHDFRAFTPTRTEHVFFDRTVSVCEWRERGDELVLVIEADAFLRHMVRVAVGTMLLVGRGAWPPERVAALLAGAPRGAAGPTAPAHPLTLVAVGYQ